MKKILGLDLGTNSIGWAIREVNNDLENQIIDKGVLTFDKGVATVKGEEFPMVKKRTESRGKRRNYQAEKYRKWELLECLITNKMCPLSMDELNKWRHYQKGVGRKYPQSKKFINWLRYDFDADGKPDFERFGFSKHESYYLFRALIVDETKTEIFKKEPQIIGRVLYQLAQRRGYNDGQNIDEIEQEELSKTILKGGGESGAAGANEIQPYIVKHKTLGAALYQIQKERNVRIRKRYNLRSDFEKEIREICRVQGLEQLFKTFWSAIIWQRPLRSQKGLVGVCTFEQNKRRCPISHPLYEEYRTWVFINNLRIRPIEEDNNKTREEQQALLLSVLKNNVYPQFLKAADFKLSSIVKELKKKGYTITAKFPDDTKVISLSFLYKMKEIWDDKWEEKTGWNDLLNGKAKKQKYNIEDLWHLHFVKKDNKKTSETAFDFLKRWGIEKLKLESTKAETFARIRFQQGYATLSLSAIKKILPYLQQGFIYSEAIYLANLNKVLGLACISDDTVKHFTEEVQRIIKQNSFDKKIIQASNELINEQLTSENRFGMDTNYQLDEDDQKDINQKLIECFGKHSWKTLLEEEKQFATITVSNKYLSFLQKKIYTKNVFEKTERMHDKIFNWIKDTYHVPESNIRHLWHPSEQETYRPAIKKDGKHYLGTPEPISKGFKNPMALKTLYKLKRLINYLISIGKIDEDTRIVIEIARELNDANKRKAIEKWQKDKEKENDEIKKIIDEINRECNTDFNREDKNLIDKIRLWEEQKRICIYTGKTIGFSDILNGVKYDYEHSIPASMSLDNELKNLTIADSYYNREIKKKKIPFDCPNYDREYIHNGICYPPIISTLQTIFGKIIETEKKIKGKIIKKRNFEKIVHLEELLAEWNAKTSDDKQIKDNIIIRRHRLKMELGYWRYKLHTFTTTEYKAGWRNSQLRDTQTITKYALPFLRTVFNKVEVQKGNITADFRKIYKIQDRLEKKERTKHSHHAIDAAVLTLIPPAAVRDKILLRYNEAKENNQDYHEKPRQWDDFHQQYIMNIENDVLINYQPEHRILTSTYKTVRKRGKVQFVKEKTIGEHSQYKIDKGGNKIPLIAQGDTIRGNLHDDSYFAAIKQPIYKESNGKFIPDTDGKGNFIFEQNVKRGDQLFFVMKPLKKLDYFGKYEDLDLIVDPNLREYFKKEIKERVSNGTSFKEALLHPIWAFGRKTDKNGNLIRPIKNIRCHVRAGGGLVTNPALIRNFNAYQSKQEYKRSYYAMNGMVPICAFYELVKENKIERELRSYSLLEVARNYKLNGKDQIVEANITKGTNLIIPLKAILRPGQKVIFYKEIIEEIKTLCDKKNISELTKRLYIFNNVDDNRLIFIHHLCSLSNEEITKEMEKRGAKKGASLIDFYNPYLKLRLSKGALNMAIEGLHFKILLDGEIMWI